MAEHTITSALLTAGGEPVEVVDNVTIADPGPDQVRVELHHCGLCHSDLSLIDGVMPATVPVQLGHEAAGIVAEVGSAVSSLKVGDKVVMTPLAACGNCYWCVRSEFGSCIRSSALLSHTFDDGTTGLSRDGEVVYRGLGVGGFGSETLAYETGAVKIDDDVPLEVAAVIGCAMQTGVGAVFNTASVEPGATVVVLGLGGIGMATVQGARLAGAAQIIVSDPLEARRELAEQLGATHSLNPADCDVPTEVHDITNGIGADYAFECAGVASLVGTALNAVRRGGTAVAVGAPPVEQGLTIDNFVLFSAMEKKLLGCLLGGAHSQGEIPRLLSLWKAGSLDLESMVSHRRPLSEINEACDDMRNGVGLRTILNCR